MVPTELQQDFRVVETDENVKGTSVHFKLLGNGMQMPDFSTITNVAAIAFADSDNIVAVELHRGLDLPGGHKEPEDTNALDTVRREAMEEACITLAGPFYVVGIIESNYYPEPSYMLIIACKVDELHDFEALHESLGRELVTPAEFTQRYTASSAKVMSELMRRAQVVHALI